MMKSGIKPRSPAFISLGNLPVMACPEQITWEYILCCLLIGYNFSLALGKFSEPGSEIIELSVGASGPEV